MGSTKQEKQIEEIQRWFRKDHRITMILFWVGFIIGLQVLVEW